MNIEAGRLYTNIKTGRVYKVLHIAAAAWDTNQVLAVYQDVEQTVWARSITEFREKFKEQAKEQAMREILFRGKRIDAGEWAYGFLDHTYEKYTIHSHNRHYCYEVNPSTVGQYTGLQAENGVLIFEGDIVELEGFISEAILPCKSRPMQIVWKDCGMWLQCIHPITKRVVTLGLIADNRTITVIGNIHDNPELLKSGRALS